MIRMTKSILILGILLPLSFNLNSQCTIENTVGSTRLNAGQWLGAGQSFVSCQTGIIKKVCYKGGFSPTRVRVIDNDNPASPIVIYDNTNPGFVSDGVFLCHELTSDVDINNGELNGFMLDYPSGGPNWEFGNNNYGDGKIFLNDGSWYSSTSWDLKFKVEVDIPLPVELIYFKATEKGNTILLSWQTSTELNNFGFLLQRSEDGIEWNDLTFVDGQDNSTQIHTYSYIDTKAGPGINYYRLKQLDLDGQYEYSEIVSARLDKGNERPVFFPNPTVEQLSFMLEATGEKNAVVSIFDLPGNLIMEKTFQILNGTNSRTLNISELPTGTYFVKFKLDNKQWQHLFAKQ